MRSTESACWKAGIETDSLHLLALSKSWSQLSWSKEERIANSMPNRNLTLLVLYMMLTMSEPVAAQCICANQVKPEQTQKRNQSTSVKCKGRELSRQKKLKNPWQLLSAMYSRDPFETGFLAASSQDTATSSLKRFDSNFSRSTRVALKRRGGPGAYLLPRAHVGRSSRKPSQGRSSAADPWQILRDMRSSRVVVKTDYSLVAFSSYLYPTP